MKTNDNEVRHPKIQLLKAIARKDKAQEKELTDNIRDLQPGFFIYDEDGTPTKMWDVWFEECMMDDDDD